MNLIETLIFGPMKMNVNVNIRFMVALFDRLLAKLRDLTNSNICITKIYLTKSSFPSKSDENKNKHSLASCEGISKFRHTFLVLPNRVSM